jgi:hypothetical protein
MSRTSFDIPVLVTKQGYERFYCSWIADFTECDSCLPPNIIIRVLQRTDKRNNGGSPQFGEGFCCYPPHPAEFIVFQCCDQGLYCTGIPDIPERRRCFILNIRIAVL